MPEDVACWADVVVTGEAYYTWPQIIEDFQNDTLKPLYNDTEWADLSGVAPLTNRVIEQVNENKNFWTPLMEITRGCPRNCSFCTAIRVSGQKMRFRPVEEIVEEIEAKLQDRPEKEIPTAEIGQFVMERLKVLDKVAYVRFASVYREFKDVLEFKKELEVLLKEK